MKKKILSIALLISLIILTTLNLLSINTNRDLNVTLASLIQQAKAEDEGGGSCETRWQLVDVAYYDLCGGQLLEYEHYHYWCEGSGIVCIAGEDFWQYDYVDCQLSSTEHVDGTYGSNCNN